ncbi:hypothetical protein KM043_013231 [Ampulex compressa]|nr:hypothetical protein KM043_013231 [Ampulex compressa]
MEILKAKDLHTKMETSRGNFPPFPAVLYRFSRDDQSLRLDCGGSSADEIKSVQPDSGMRLHSWQGKISATRLRIHGWGDAFPRAARNSTVRGKHDK